MATRRSIELPFTPSGQRGPVAPESILGLEDPTLTEEVLGGLVTGVRRDPLLRPAVNAITDFLPGATQADLDTLERRLAGSKISDVFEIIGEYGPTFALGAGAFGAGRVAARAGLQAFARSAAGRGVGGRLGGQLGRVAARAEDVAGNVAGRRFVKPGLERGSEILGSAVGEASFSGAREAARGGTPGEIAESAALGAALSGGFETGLLGLGRVLSPRARNIDPRVAVERFRGTGAQEFAKRKADASSVMNRLTARIDDAVGRERQELDILRAANLPTAGPAFIPETVRSRVQAQSAKRLAQARRIQSRTQQRVQGIRNQMDALDMFGDPEDVILTNVAREAPQKFEGLLGDANRIVARLAQTPEALGGKLGITGQKFVKSMADAEAQISIGSATNRATVANFVGRLSNALGRKAPKSLKDADKKLADVWEVAGKEGIPGVRAKFGNEAASLFEELSEELTDMYGHIVRAGGRPFMTEAELLASGNAMYLPQVLRQDIPKEEMFNRIVQHLKRKKGLTDSQAADQANSILNQQFHEGLQKFGSIDHQRVLQGTLKEKLDEGMPFEGAFTGLSRYLDEVVRRVAVGSRVGINGELRDGIVNAAVREGADAPLMNTLVNHFLGQDYGSASARRLAQNITSLQSGTKLTYAPIANMMQSINTAVAAGIRNTARQMGKALTGARDADISKAVGAATTEFDALNRVFSGVREDSILDRFARRMLSITGFSQSERLNRYVAGAASQEVLVDRLAKGVAGKLRGPALQRARTQLGDLNIDLDKVVDKVRELGQQTRPPGSNILFDAVEAVHGAGSYDRALFRGAQLSQFTPGKTRVPLAWQSPLGRVLTQFKTFALNQGIFLRDQVLAEASRGNMKPLATVAGIYPLAGELVGDMLAVGKGRERDTHGLARLLENVTYVGGAGIAQSAMAAAQHGRLGDMFLGPTASDALAIGENMLQGDAEGLVQQVERQPIVTAFQRLMLGGAVGLDNLLEYAELDSDEGRPSRTVSVDELFRESKARQPVR